MVEAAFGYLKLLLHFEILPIFAPVSECLPGILIVFVAKFLVEAFSLFSMRCLNLQL